MSNTVWNILWYVIMGIGVIGMIWSVKSQNRTANAKLYAIICLVVVLISTTMILWRTLTGFDPEQERAIANNNQFEKAKLSQIAEFVNKNYAGKDIVILVRKDMIPTESNSDYVRIDPVKELTGMLKGVTVKQTVVIEPPKGTEEMPEIDVSSNPEIYNKMFLECKSLSPAAIIDLAGLPMGENQALVIWKWDSKKDPKIILPEIGEFGISFGPADVLNGIVDAVIVTRKEHKFNFMEDEAPKDLKEAFDTLYVLVTKDNVKDLVKNNVITVQKVGN